MQSNWQTKKLGEICTVSAGNSAPQKKEFFINGKYPFFRTSDVGIVHIGKIDQSADFLNNKGVKGMRLFKKGTILFPKSGASTFLNHRAIMGVDGYVSSHLATIKTDDSVLDSSYLFYFLQEIKAQDLIQDHKYPSLNLPVIEDIEVSYPESLPEQRHIVKTLDEVFEKVTKAKENAEKNLQNSKELFESYLQSVFENPGKDWEEKKLGEVCDFVGGSQPPKSVFTKIDSPNNIRLIQIRDYKSDKNLVYIPRSLAKRFCKANDVMIGRYGPPLFQILRGLDGAYNVALMKATPDELKLSRDFLFYFLKNPAILEYIIYHSQRAAGQIGLTKEILEPYPIALPSLNEQQIVVKRIEMLSVETEKLEKIYEQKLVDLEELKKSVLKKAFKGEL